MRERHCRYGANKAERNVEKGDERCLGGAERKDEKRKDDYAKPCTDDSEAFRSTLSRFEAAAELDADAMIRCERLKDFA